MGQSAERASRTGPRSARDVDGFFGLVGLEPRGSHRSFHGAAFEARAGREGLADFVAAVTRKLELHAFWRAQAEGGLVAVLELDLALPLLQLEACVSRLEETKMGDGWPDIWIIGVMN